MDQIARAATDIVHLLRETPRTNLTLAVEAKAMEILGRRGANAVEMAYGSVDNYEARAKELADSMPADPYTWSDNTPPAREPVGKRDGAEIIGD